MNAVQENPREKPAILWFGVLGGHVAWTAHLLVAYFLVEIGCKRGFSDFTLLVVLATAVPALVALAAGLSAYRSYRLPTEDEHGGESRIVGRVHFMGLLGVILSALYIFAIILGGVGILFLPTCA